MSNYDNCLKQFAERVRAEGKVWGLKGEDGWAVCSSIEFEDTDVYPFFSSESAARQLCSGEWDIYTPTSIPLEDFLADWLPGMHEDNAMVGPDWDAELEGEEVEPADLAAALEG